MGKNKKNNSNNNNNNNKENKNNHNNNNNNNNKNVKCAKCGRQGHTANNCLRDVKCTNCEKTGHKAENCRNNSNQNNNNQNNNQQNNNQQRTDQKKKNIKLTRPCSFCKGRHLDKDCNVRSGLGPDGKPLKCKHCSGPHYNNQCWDKPGILNPTSNTNKPEGQYNQYYNPNIGKPVSMASLLLRPCRYCMGEHLSDLCPHKDVLDPQNDFSEPDPSAYSYPGPNPQNAPEQQWYDAASRIQPFWGVVQNPPPSRKWQDDDPTRHRRDPDDSVPIHRTHVNGEYRSYGYKSEHPAFRERDSSRVAYDDERDVVMEDVENTGYDFTDEQKMDHFSRGIQDVTLEALHARRRLSELRRGGILDSQYRPMFGTRYNEGNLSHWTQR